MIRNILLFFSFALLTSSVFSTPLMAEDFITLNFPESVIAKATAAIFPLRIDAHSKSIEGDITIIKISELQLTDHHLACRLHLAGRNMAILTEIAGHEIRLKMGFVEVDFKTDAEIRFDTKKKILFVKPVIDKVSTSGAGSNAEISQALVALLNGREFPVTLQKLDAIIAKAGSKTITINTTVANIEAKSKSIQISLLPAITAQ